jgi:hypothetical protein
MWNLLLEFFFVRAVTRLLGVRGCSLLLLYTTVAVAIFGAIMHAASYRRMQHIVMRQKDHPSIASHPH